MNFIDELNKVGLTEDQFEACLSDIKDKLEGIQDIEWEEIRDKYNLQISSCSLRKACSRPFGGIFVNEYYKHKNRDTQNVLRQDELDLKMEQLRKEKMKLQTLNIERNRLDRSAARQELFFEYIGNTCAALPLPDFQPLVGANYNDRVTYCLTLADFHYGAKFESFHNSYSKEIFRNRLLYLGDRMVDFVVNHNVNKLHVVELGDTLQGIIRMNDLQINDGSVVRSLVEVCRLLAIFLNELSKYVQIEYYHVPYANHTQVRVLGTKVNELCNEDLEYVVGHYLKDLLVMNDRVNVHNAPEGDSFINVEIPGYNVVAMHGHQIRSIKSAVKDLSVFARKPIQYLMLGHFHNCQEICSNEGLLEDTEILVSPSFVGSDPYADTLIKGNKAAVKIYGFDETEGHTESYKIILN